MWRPGARKNYAGRIECRNACGEHGEQDDDLFIKDGAKTVVLGDAHDVPVLGGKPHCMQVGVRHDLVASAWPLALRRRAWGSVLLDAGAPVKFSYICMIARPFYQHYSKLAMFRGDVLERFRLTPHVMFSPVGVCR